MQGSKTKKVLKYAFMPEILPRAQNLFASGFGYIAFLMASVYNMVRLIPPNHPYLQPENIGKFGIRHVIAEAANNLVFKRKNIDQVVIFAALLAAIVILTLQFVLLIYTFIIQPAFAQAFTGTLFDTPNPTNDIAFLLLDNVFGIPRYSCNIANVCSSVSATLGANGLPFHIALHSMFQFYSIGLLLIGVLIFLYFVLVVVAETATSGTPFGQRFQNVWVPIRLVVALGLLLPINHGLNSGQYITLFAAKAGSGFATNSWLRFNRTIATVNPLSSNPTGETEMVAKPQVPDMAPLVSFMSLAHSCAYAHWKYEKHYANTARPTEAILNDPTRPPKAGAKIKPYFVKLVRPWLNNTNPVQVVNENTTYEQALDFYDNGDIIIRFGRIKEHSTDPNAEENFKSYAGGIEPTCGELRVKITDKANLGQGAAVGGAEQMQQYYYNLVKQMWFETTATKIINLSHRYTEKLLQNKTDIKLVCNIGCGDADLPSCAGAEPRQCSVEDPGADAKIAILNTYNGDAGTQVNLAWANYNRFNTAQYITNDVLDRGWGGAGIWYNKIAEMNGAFITSVVDIPSAAALPMHMERVMEAKVAQDSSVTPETKYKPNFANNKIPKGLNVPISSALYNYYNYWNEEGANQSDEDKTVTPNAVETAINLIFGTSGLFEMRSRANINVHPLSQLTAVGKGLVDAAIRNIAGSSAMAFLGGAGSVMTEFAPLGKYAKIGSDFLITTAFVGLTAGLVLFYILPFLPFVYFYFAVGAWVKSIFEAMVGVPLWALAHLRIDGEGLPGESATNGYFLIFEIFIRPIMTVFGLIAAMIIFTTQVRVLNFIWGMVVDNLTGSDVGAATSFAPIFEVSLNRTVVDQFFYTIIYTIIVYMLATATFKLIDRIPDNILRWMGAGVSSFSDINDDPVEGLTKYAALGGLTVGQQTARGFHTFSGQMGGQFGTAYEGLRGRLTTAQQAKIDNATNHLGRK